MNDFIQETSALTKRWFLHTLRQPIALAAGLFQPLIWLFLFGSVFRNMRPEAMQAAGGNYTAFLAAGVIVFTAFSSAFTSGVPLLFDKENHFLDRLLVAPLSSRFSIVAASAIHIGIMSFLQSALVLGAAAWWSGGFVFNATGLAGVFLFTGLLILGFTALSLALAFGLNAHFEMLSLIQVVALPLIFMSSALAPMSIMPVWLQWAASFNALTYTIEPVRRLLLGGTWPSGVLVAAPWASFTAEGCLAFLAFFVATSLGMLALVLRRSFR